jgi:hypothetical protein
MVRWEECVNGRRLLYWNYTSNFLKGMRKTTERLRIVGFIAEIQNRDL